MSDMGSDADRASRRGVEGTAVSSGESSAANPRPALGSDGMTLAEGSDTDFTQVGTQRLPVSPSPVPKRDSSDDATITEVRRRRDPSSGVPNQVFAAIGATLLEVGTVLGGRYQIQQLLGMGGMGAVYKAHDLEVDRTVGLKIVVCRKLRSVQLQRTNGRGGWIEIRKEAGLLGRSCRQQEKGGCSKRREDEELAMSHGSFLSG